jgi:polygalacturonase
VGSAPRPLHELTVRGVTIRSHGPNNDGCDPESCRDVLIEKCTFDTGDDCIALKSGRNEDGRRLHTPIENVVIRDCDMRDGHGGVVIGSEISGGARNIFAEKCRMDSPRLDRVLRFKNNAARGGVIERIAMRDVTVGEVARGDRRGGLLLRGRPERRLQARAARRGRAERHEPQEPLRVRAPRIRGVTDCQRPRERLHVRWRAVTRRARGRPGLGAGQRQDQRSAARRTSESPIPDP